MTSAAQQSRQRATGKGATSKSQRPRLRVIDHSKLKRESRRRTVVIGVILFVAGCLFVTAFVQATLVQRQHRLDQINSEIVVAKERSAQLERDVMIASAPVVIVERAEVLGMVRSQDPVYLVANQYVAGRLITGQLPNAGALPASVQLDSADSTATETSE